MKLLLFSQHVTSGQVQDGAEIINTASFCCGSSLCLAPLCFSNLHTFLLLSRRFTSHAHSQNATSYLSQWHTVKNAHVWQFEKPFFSLFPLESRAAGFLRWRSSRSSHISLLQSRETHFTDWARHFPSCVVDGQHSVGQCFTVARVCVCVFACMRCLLPKHWTGLLHLCVNVDSRWSGDCHSSRSPSSARHWSLHISRSLLPKPSSTDAAAELISSKSMTESLWKHFYLCVCLCG